MILICYLLPHFSQDQHLLISHFFFYVEISFTDYRQFVVAAATTMLASSTSSDIRLTREEMANMFGSISWWTSDENVYIYIYLVDLISIV